MLKRWFPQMENFRAVEKYKVTINDLLAENEKLKKAKAMEDLLRRNEQSRKANRHPTAGWTVS